MKQTYFFLLLMLFSVRVFSTEHQKITLTADGRTSYCIIISVEANEYELQAATDLQYYLKLISGADFPILADTVVMGKHEIIIGKNKHFYQLLLAAETQKIKWDGFYIRTDGDYLIIDGGDKKGIQYGVYAFLETYLGCRFYAPEALIIPAKPDIKLPIINDIQEPAFFWREAWFRDTRHNSSFTDWNRLNTYEDRQKNWGMFVHTFKNLIPEERYFDAHPEWFSEINGKRVRDGQLCLTNESVYKELIENLRKEMEKRPEALYWSVSPNDNYNNCSCISCRASDEKYGAPSGTLLTFVNHIAEEFPDKIISTLAYQYTRQAPKGIRPAENVNIMFCSIECDRSLPIVENISEANFRNDMQNWSELSDNIFMWDYVVQFRNYMDPFPNIFTLQSNLQYFFENNCLMMFEQGSDGNVTEFYELRSYLLAKLMWNPYCDFDSLLNDYLNGYYGAAGKYIREYIEIMYEASALSGKRLDIYGYPANAKESYLTSELLKIYAELFDKASLAVKDDAILTKRVQQASLPLEFAYVDLAMHDITPDISYYDIGKKGDRTVNAAMLQRLNSFVHDCSKFNIASLEEYGYAPEEYKKDVLHFVEKGLVSNLAFRKPVTIFTQWSRQYDVGGPPALTDGKFGILDYHYNWLGFQGEHLEAMIDLEQKTIISKISIDFLTQPLSWIFLPEQVEFYTSNDGEKWNLLGTEVTPTQPKFLQENAICKYAITVEKEQCRYVKIKGISPLICPEWHRGWGEPCWIFTDEILVQ